MKLSIARNKMDLDQFNEWVARQPHGEIKASATIKGAKLNIEVTSKCLYTMEDARAELDFIAANGY